MDTELNSNIVTAHAEILSLRDLARVARLNNAGWKSMLVVNPQVGVSEMIPANKQLARRFKLDEYLHFDCSGFSSEAQKLPALDSLKPRLTNLWYVKFASLHPGVKVEFLRSGTIVHYGEEDPQRLDQITLKNLNQLLNTAKAISQANDFKTLKFLNLDLQTGASGALVDRSDLEQRTVAYQRFLLQSAEITATATEVQTFNIPAHEESAAIAEHWVINESTRRQIQSLAISSFEAIDPGIKDFVRPTLEELSELLNNQSSGNQVALRFALLSRLSVIASLGGWVVHFNCRSGKDRTGFLDAEIKFLTYQIWRRSQNLPVSAPGQQVLTEEKEAWRHILLETGNVKIQELNTGLKGSKLDRGALKERVGADLWQSFIGSSRLART